MTPLKGEPCDEETNTPTSTQRYLSIPRLATLLILCTIGGYWISGKLGDWPTAEVNNLLMQFISNILQPLPFSQLDEEHSEFMTKRIQELEKARKDEEDFQRDFRRSLSPNDTSELVMGSLRYKLVKKPKLSFKQGNKYCKKMEGQLAIGKYGALLNFGLVSLDFLQSFQFVLQKTLENFSN